MSTTPQPPEMPNFQQLTFDVLDELRNHVIALRKIVIERGLITLEDYNELLLQISVAVKSPDNQISDL